jgi:hypothetical protein
LAVGLPLAQTRQKIENLAQNKVYIPVYTPSMVYLFIYFSDAAWVVIIHEMM